MQGEAQVRLVFAGEILEGFQPDEVKRRFGASFKLDEARLAAMFSGARTVLKRSLSATEAARYVAQLGKMGARIHVEPLQAAPVIAAAPTAAPALAPASANAHASASTAALPAAATSVPALAPLEEEITCPNCGERQTKRVLCRSCTTDMPRGIAAKKEDAERARNERLDAARAGGRWAPPRSAGGDLSSGATVDPPPMLGLGFEGRMGRVSYFNACGLAGLCLAWMGIGAARGLLPQRLSMLMLIPLGLALLLFLFWTLRVTVLRLHDFNRSGWWVLVSFIPYVGAIMCLMGAVPGSPEENDYGEKPRRGNVVVAAVVLVLSLIALLVIGRMAMSSYDKYSERSAGQATEANADSDTGADADADADPATLQHAAQYLSSPAALDAFSEYARAPTHKAFAASDSGAWGWRSGKASAREAASSALATCEEHRKPYTSECRLVNVNGQWPKES
jgi:uncharacterized membrane protein YhaH (DUF805 family)